MSNKNEKPIKDLPVDNAAEVKGGTDSLHLLAQVNHLQSQNANNATTKSTKRS